MRPVGYIHKIYKSLSPFKVSTHIASVLFKTVCILEGIPLHGHLVLAFKHKLYTFFMGKS